MTKLLGHYPDAKRLDVYANVNCGPFGSEIKLSDYVEAGVPLLRITNITKQGQIDETDLVFISEDKANDLASTQVRPGDMVISQRGTLGMPAIVPDSYAVWNISANLIAARNLKGVSAEFVQLYLSSETGGKQIERTQSGQVQGKITTEDVASVLVPQTSLEHELVADMQTARERRARQIDQAFRELFGIDAFLLNALGLTLPPSASRLTYAITSKSLSVNRLDAHFYTPYLVKTEQAISSLPVPIVALTDLLQFAPVNGLDARDYVDKGRRYLRVQNIRQFEITPDNVTFVETDKTKNVDLRGGDVLLTRKGTYGVAAMVTTDVTDCLISSEIMLLRLKNNALCSADYLVAWLNCSAARRLLRRHKSGAIMGHITQEVVNDFVVPIPSQEVQEQIAREIEMRRQASRTLREAAAQEWEAAKAAFERKLLG